MGVEKKDLEVVKQDPLAMEKAKEITDSTQEIRGKLDEEFENLKKATALKDEIVGKIETTIDQALEGNNFLKKHIDKESFTGSIEKMFYLLDDDADKVIVMQSILDGLNSTEQMSVSDIHETIMAKIEGKLSFFDRANGENLHIMDMSLSFISLMICVSLIIGFVMGSIEAAIGVFIGFGLFTFSLEGVYHLDKHIEEKKLNKLDRHEFFDKINDYIPDITRQDFDFLYGKYKEFGELYFLTNTQRVKAQEKIFSLLEDYKETEGVITQEEVSELIGFLEQEDSILSNNKRSEPFGRDLQYYNYQQ